MKKSLLFSCVVWMVACGGAEVNLEQAPPSSERSVSQQRRIPDLFEQCIEDGECPPNYCVTQVIQSSACASGQAYVCGNTSMYTCQ